jgi:alkanesulfonate monooxygenase SsuD/methylene tetrahydromethanopterin reductase-like flavin-dependent oxidoreductase (luciferase family)
MIGSKYRLEGWTQLAWIAARYPDQMIGTDVLCNSFRHPPLLAKMAASLQALSDGRLILGYGAGWVPEEYEAYGMEYPSARVRIAQMAEAIRLMREMWTQSPASYEGEFYSIVEAYCEPQPDPVPPILIGGEGERYLLRAVAELADYWLPMTRTLEVLKRKIEVLQQHCREVSRDFSSIEIALTVPVFLSPDPSAAEEWAGDRLKGENPPFAGTPADLQRYLRDYVDAGVTMFHLVFPGFPDTEDMELFVTEVMPAFA